METLTIAEDAYAGTSALAQLHESVSVSTIYIDVCVYIYIYVYVLHMYIYIYIHTYIHSISNECVKQLVKVVYRCVFGLRLQRVHLSRLGARRRARYSAVRWPDINNNVYIYIYIYIYIHTYICMCIY